MLMIEAVLLLLLCISNGCSALDYSDLEGLGAACDGYDSCESPKMSQNFSKRNCECDAECATYGDCCIDANRSPTTTMNDMLHCIQHGTTPNRGAYVIRGCPGGGSPLCLDPDPADPMVSAPVSILGGPRHYFNAHCAECNGEDMSRLVAWTPLVACDSLAHYNLSAAFVWAELKRDGDDWVVPFKGQLHKCTVLYDKPQSVQSGVRPCRAGVVRSCASGYRRKAVRVMCEDADSYTAVVYTTREAYRNPHCALCNGVSVEELYCDADELLSGKNKFSIALLFDVDTKNGDEVGVHKTGGCSDGQVYDAFHKKCRNLVCGIPGHSLVDGKCKKTR